MSGAAARTGYVKKESLKNYRKQVVFRMIKPIIICVMVEK